MADIDLPKQLLLKCELSDGAVCMLMATAPITAETLAELREYLAVYERVLAKRSTRAAAQAHADAEIARERGAR